MWTILGYNEKGKIQQLRKAKNLGQGVYHNSDLSYVNLKASRAQT